MAKSLRSKSQRKNRRVKREDDKSVFKATEALRVARLAAKLKQSALKKPVRDENDDEDDEEGFETEEPSQENTSSAMQVEGSSTSAAAADIEQNEQRKPKISTSGPRMSAREKYRSKRNLQVRLAPKTIYRAPGEKKRMGCKPHRRR